MFAAVLLLALLAVVAHAETQTAEEAVEHSLLRCVGCSFPC